MSSTPPDERKAAEGRYGTLRIVTRLGEMDDSTTIIVGDDDGRIFSTHTYGGTTGVEEDEAVAFAEATVACVNALSGVAEPGAAIKAAREAMKKALEWMDTDMPDVKGLQATRLGTVTRLLAESIDDLKGNK